MDSVIEVEHLTHRYGRRSIYTDLNFSIPPGKMYGLLGKSGVGKTTLIEILMGFLRTESGLCRVSREDCHALTPATRARIGLLFEGHVSYEFMSIAQVERFYAPFYARWDRDLFYCMVAKLGRPDEPDPQHVLRPALPGGAGTDHGPCAGGAHGPRPGDRPRSGGPGIDHDPLLPV